MARTHKSLPTAPTRSNTKGARSYVPLIPGSGQGNGYWQSLVMRPARYAISFRRDPRFPVLNDTGHEVAAPADHQTDATRRGGDRIGINHGAGTPERKLL